MSSTTVNEVYDKPIEYFCIPETFRFAKATLIIQLIVLGLSITCLSPITIFIYLYISRYFKNVFDQAI